MREARMLFRSDPDHYFDREVKFRFARFLKHGTRFGSDKDKEYRDLLTTGTPGQSFIPQEFYPSMIQAQKSWGNLINYVNLQMTDTGAPMKISMLGDTSSELVDLSEGSAPTELDFTASSQLPATDLYSTGLIKVTVQELNDAGFDPEKWMADVFGRRYFRGLAHRISAGSTSGNVQSLITGATAGFTTASATAISYADLLGLYGSLDPAYRESAAFAMNDNTRISLLGVLDSTGRPVLQVNPSTGALDVLLGKPVALNPWAPDIAAGVVGPIQFGDFREGYTLRVASPGVGINRLKERFADTLEVGFIGSVRASGTITDAGTHPIKNLTMHT